MRLVTDVFAFCASHVPRWNTISVSGYHIREAGATAAQELAFTLRNGIEYVDYAIEAGLDVDVFAPRISFFFNSHSDFFEEIAKFRAARRIWARVMRDRFKAVNPRSWQLRFHAQTAGVSLTAQQPYNNVVRTALQALAATFGGNPVAAHERARRGARVADRGRSHAGAADAADHRARDRHRRCRRSARRFVLPREADRRDRGRGDGVHRPDRSHGRHGAGDRARLSAEGNRGERIPVPAFGRIEGAGDRRRQRIREHRSTRGSGRCISTSRPATGSSHASTRPAAGAIERASNAAIDRLQSGAKSESNLMPLLIEAVQGPCHRWGDVRRSAGSLGRVRRGSDNLKLQ